MSLGTCFGTIYRILFGGARREDDTSIQWLQRLVTMVYTFFSWTTGVLFYATNETRGESEWLRMVIEAIVLVVLTIIYFVIRIKSVRSEALLVLPYFVLEFNCILQAYSLEGVIQFAEISLVVLFTYTLSGLPPKPLVGLGCLHVAFAIPFYYEQVFEFGFYDAIPHLKATYHNPIVGRIIVGGLIPLILELLVLFAVKRLRVHQEVLATTANATKLFANRIAVYDTHAATAVIEDHEDVVNPKLAQCFREIVENLDGYRPFLPEAVQPHRKMSSSSLLSSRSQSISTGIGLGLSTGGGLGLSAAGGISMGAMSGASVSGLHNPFLAMADDDNLDDDMGSSISSSSDVNNSEDATQWAQKFTAEGAVGLIHLHLNPKESDDDNSRIFALAVSEIGFLCREHGATLQSTVGTTVMVTWSHRAQQKKLVASICSFACALRTVFIGFQQDYIHPTLHSDPNTSRDSIQTINTATNSDSSDQSSTGSGSGIGPSPVVATSSGSKPDSHNSTRHNSSSTGSSSGTTTGSNMGDSQQQDNGKTNSGEGKHPVELCSVPCAVSCAIDLGPILYGAVGDEFVKLFCVLGPFDSTGHRAGNALNLLFQAAKFHNAIVVSHAVAKLCPGIFHVRGIDAVQWHRGGAFGAGEDDAKSVGKSTAAAAGGPSSSSSKSDKHTAVKVFEVVAPVASEPEDIGSPREWMYSLEKQSEHTSPYGVCELMTRALEKYCVGNHDEAAVVLAVLSNQQRQDRRVQILEALVLQARKSGQLGPYVRRVGFDVSSKTAAPTVMSLGTPLATAGGGGTATNSTGAGKGSFSGAGGDQGTANSSRGSKPRSSKSSSSTSKRTSRK